MGKAEEEVNFVLHNTIKQVNHDLEIFQFNTAIARLMELVNAMYKYMDAGDIHQEFMLDTTKTLIKLLAPFAPHFAEEMNEQLGEPYSIFNQAFPTWDESALVKDTVQLALQVNGKVRTKFEVDASMSKEQIEELVRTEYTRYFGEKQVRKIIVVPGRIVNVVVG